MSLEDTNFEKEQASKFRMKLEEFSFKPSQAPPLRRSPKSESRRNSQIASDVSILEAKKRVGASLDRNSPKKAKKKQEYAAPETYAHLNHLTDCLGEYLDVMFCGINPGVHSATVGHHFAHPGNRFYKMLHGSGFTDRLVPPDEDTTLPALYNIGITDIVDRPSSCENELSSEEMIEGVPTLLKKVARYKPRFVCFIGKGMGQKVEKGFKREINKNDAPKLQQRHSASPRRSTSLGNARRRESLVECERMVWGTDSGVGLRPYKVIHEAPASPVCETLFFVSHSSSGLATSMNLQGKVKLLKDLRELVAKHKAGTLDTSSSKEVPVPTDTLPSDHVL